MSARTCAVAVAVSAIVARGAQALAEAAHAPVVGAELVAPLGDAVGLVDHEQGDARRVDRPQERGRAEPLGRDVEQRQAPGARALEDGALGLLGHVGVEGGGRDPRPVEPGELVGHQRDER